jgi:hypothetical protein
MTSGENRWRAKLAAPTTTLRAHIEKLEARTKARFEAAPKNGKVRCFRVFLHGAASWSRPEHIIARVEAGAEGPDTRFIVTNLKTRNARVLYEDVYCQRGQAENHIKSFKAHLSADYPSRFLRGRRARAIPFPRGGRRLGLGSDHQAHRATSDSRSTPERMIST